MKLDLKSNTRTLRERLQSETDPVLRRNVATVIRHIEGEIANRVELTMSTMVAEPAIRSFFSSLVGRFEPAPVTQSAQSLHDERCVVVRGGAAVRAMYNEVCRMRLVWTHFDVDVLAVDRHCIIQAGLFHCPTTGAGLKELGRAVEDENAIYLGIGRLIAMFPFDVKSGLLLGEDLYVDPATFDGAERRRVHPDDYLPGYDDVVDLPQA
jgi:hypothetical protein